MDEETIAFIMTDRLTHKNLRSNPHAAYLFMESGKKFVGKRLCLKKVKEERDSPLPQEKDSSNAWNTVPRLFPH
jgi:hypothetical protein